MMKNKFVILSLFIIISCTNSKDKSMPAKSEDKQVTQNSTSGYAPVNGLKMYYEIHGEGMPLVLIHGGGSTIQTSFSKMLPLLAQHYRVIAVELQAHGHTNDRDSAESFEQDADDVAGLLEYLKTSKAHFLGFSNGGNTAMQIAIRHSHLVDKLVIISSFYKREGMIPGFFEGMQQATLENMPPLLKTYYLQINHDQKGLQTMFNKDKERMLHFRDWKEEDLASITNRSLIIAGDKDVVTAEHTVKMSQIIPNAQLMILPGTHGSFIGEVCAAEKGSKMPEMTIAMIKEFLDK
ncbi:MAG TPA: alpha/beta hydrolase [Chitinophagaceae bacterium]|nr:alpha/beta hydrolase [Chitinophagaceae bacterium]